MKRIAVFMLVLLVLTAGSVRTNAGYAIDRGTRSPSSGVYTNNEWNVLVLIYKKVSTREFKKSFTDKQIVKMIEFLNDFPRTMEGLSEGRMKIGYMDFVVIDEPVTTTRGAYGDITCGDGQDVQIEGYLEGKDYQLIMLFGPLRGNRGTDGWLGLGGYKYLENGHDIHMIQINEVLYDSGNRKYTCGGKKYNVNMAAVIHETLHCVETNSGDNGFTSFQEVHNAEQNGYNGEGYEFLDWYHDLMTDKLKTGRRGFSEKSFIVKHRGQNRNSAGQGRENADPVNVGQIVTFGRYEQDNNTGNGKESIEWLVLDVRDGKALLISRYALDCRPYDKSNTSATWETCSLRSWLNGTFLKSAFSAKDQQAILSTEVLNSNDQGIRDWNTIGGNKTKDRVFLLSYAEATRYFMFNGDQRCAWTDYAVERGAFTESNQRVDGGLACWWMLRSPGRDQNLAACVTSNGDISDCYLNDSRFAVRPALWVDLGSL